MARRFVEPLTVVAVAVGGVLGGMGAMWGLMRWQRLRVPSVPAAQAGVRARGGRTVEPADLEAGRRELNTLLLEKEVLSAALTRVYEAEAEGKVSRAEREVLAGKYRGQLRGVDEKLAGVEALIEVGELEVLRGEVVGLLERKVEQIEGRLGRARGQLARVRPAMAVQVAAGAPEGVVEAPAPEAEKERAKGEKRAEPEVERRVREVREEVMEALARLEQMDLEE